MLGTFVGVRRLFVVGRGRLLWISGKLVRNRSGGCF